MTMYIGTALTKGAGYLLNGEKLNVSQREEADIRTCTHCQRVIKLQEWRQRGAWCNRCFAPICIPCGVEMQTKGCTPFLKKIEAIAEQMLRFDSLGMLEKNAAGHVISQPQIVIPALKE